MTEINNDDYRAALELVETKELQVLKQVKVHIDELCDYLSSKTSEINMLKEPMPSAGRANTNIRSTIDSSISQIQGTTSQLGYLKASIDSILNPAGVP